MNKTIFYKKTITQYEHWTSNTSMLDLVLLIIAAITSLAAVFTLCCYCMNRSDKKLQKYVMALAKRRGWTLDPRELKGPAAQTEPNQESCPVLLADAGIIVP